MINFQINATDRKSIYVQLFDIFFPKRDVLNVLLKETNCKLTDPIAAHFGPTRMLTSLKVLHFVLGIS